jgi:hypothetical protein
VAVVAHKEVTPAVEAAYSLLVVVRALMVAGPSRVVWEEAAHQPATGGAAYYPEVEEAAYHPAIEEDGTGVAPPRPVPDVIAAAEC